ncbi:unnamed protein product [Caenorhabditis sp. 36 PRJEB53466]|nr:unnamed protein product [Caenorhabditis sp. 36 PRJEB53466]
MSRLTIRYGILIACLLSCLLTIIVNRISAINSKPTISDCRNASSIRTETYEAEFCIAFNFLEATESFRGPDGLEPITLAVHSTSDAMRTAEKKASEWDGPISWALFIDGHSLESVEYVANVHRCVPEFRRKVTVHFAFRLSPFQAQCPTVERPGTVPDCQEFLQNRGKLRNSLIGPFQVYPINAMRNVARLGAKSDLHFLADVDMVPSGGMAEKVKRIANEVIDGNARNVLVVRRFESQGSEIPRDLQQLKSMFERKKVFEFHHKFFFVGHRIPDIGHWFNVSSHGVASWPIPYQSSAWEVQVILHRRAPYNAVYFPSRIRDMQSLIYELCRAEYTFHLVANVFNVHEGVKTNDSMYSQVVTRHQRAYGTRAYKRYVQEMDDRYPSTRDQCGSFNM